MANPHVIWETLLATLRGTIVKFSKKKKRQINNHTRELENNITKLDRVVTTGMSTIKDLEDLYKLNNKLLEVRKEELKGALIKSRADWLDLGEKPSKFFLNLENRNKVNIMINEIKLDDNTIIRDQSAILNEIKKFYEKLYSSKTIPEEEGDDITLTPQKITMKKKSV